VPAQAATLSLRENGLSGPGKPGFSLSAHPSYSLRNKPRLRNSGIISSMKSIRPAFHTGVGNSKQSSALAKAVAKNVNLLKHAWLNCDSDVAPINDLFNTINMTASVSTKSFAAAVQPIVEKTVIITDNHGLIAGDVDIPTADGTIPAYRAARQWAKQMRTALKAAGSASGIQLYPDAPHAF
jgi:hypothetical protein